MRLVLIRGNNACQRHNGHRIHGRFRNKLSRTYSHTCVGFARRDISIAVYNSTLDDATLSDVRVDGSIEVDDYAETARETVSLVRSDAGNLEGYNATFTGTVSDGSSTIPV